MQDPLLVNSNNNNMQNCNQDDDTTTNDSDDQMSTLLQNDENDNDHEGNTGHPSFFKTFIATQAPRQILFTLFLSSFGFGITIGAIPRVMVDRFATLYHGLSESGLSSCTEKPGLQACLEASADAQNVSAITSFISNGFMFLTSSMIGSFSDEYGRRGLILAGVFLTAISTGTFFLMQLLPKMSPYWYYGAYCATGLFSSTAVSLSALADVLPPHWRAPGIGLLLAGIFVGFGFAPTLAIFLTDFQTSIISFATLLLSLVSGILFLPETVPPEMKQQARNRLMQQQEEQSGNMILFQLMRPLRELSIINRNCLFRLLSTLAFFTGVVSSGDQSLLLYYVQSKLEFTSTDVAILFLLLGLGAVFAQGVLLKPLNDLLGERILVASCFFLGTIHNFMYGLATNKQTLFAAVVVGSFSIMAYPTISAIKANNVEDSEQGRIQGALNSLQSLASALGPITLRYVATLTHNPGSMFIFAGCLYIIAMFVSLTLPKDKVNTRAVTSINNNNNNTLEELPKEEKSSCHTDCNNAHTETSTMATDGSEPLV